MTRAFGLTWDYRCPYGRIAHNHVVTGLLHGADWNVDFLPFCLGQSHVEEGMPPIWDTPQLDSGLFALQVGIAARDADPEKFLPFHMATFEYRHTRAGNLNDRTAIASMLTDAGFDPDAIFATVETGAPLATIAREHMQYVNSHDVWGVPTFIVNDKAVFVRLLQTANGDGKIAIDTVNRILDNIDWPILNEFKHTSVPQ
ncbi:MAG: hypothetical protein RJB08_1027 [Actinomycetota bacterium]